MMDRQAIWDFFDALRDKYTATEIVNILEDAGVIDIDDITSNLYEYILDNRDKFEV